MQRGLTTLLLVTWRFCLVNAQSIHVLYQSSWSTTNIHYNAGNGWTKLPGEPMQASTTDKYPAEDGWFQYDIKAASALLAFNDGGSKWDNNNEHNYKVDAAGTVTYPKASAGCSNFNGQDTCKSDQISYGEEHDQRKWQTPSRNNSEYKPEYQDFRSLTGYASVQYASDRKSATVTARTFQRVAGASCQYSFNGQSSSSNEFKVDSSLAQDLIIVVTCAANGETWTLQLEPVNFVWQNHDVKQPESMENGQRGAVVDLFGWPFKDIEQECQDFLGKAGYMGVKINPPQESVMSDDNDFDGQRNPWWVVYQPVSYKLHSRLGSRAELRSMIQTCRANGIRVYADAVINHMSANGNDILRHRSGNGNNCNKWGPRSSSAGSPYFTFSSTYELSKETKQRPTLEFPAVPYGPTDFHCDRGIDNWADPFLVGNGWLVGLSDLDTGKDNVRERIAQYLVDLMGIGFSGFRIDAAKHIRPHDLAGIYGYFNKFMGGNLPADFISWHEILLGGEARMLACTEDGDYNYYQGLDWKLQHAGLSAQDVAKIKTWSSDYPSQAPVCGRWILPPSRFVIQNDDHDQQFGSSRDMGGKGSILVKEKNVDRHRNFELQLFNVHEQDDWKIRVVLSSYTLMNDVGGFPDGNSDCKGFKGDASKCSINVPYEKAFRQGSCGYTVEDFKGGKYTRVHRDLQIVNAMRKWLSLPTVTASQVGIGGNC